jgi:hypothetical protein
MAPKNGAKLSVGKTVSVGKQWQLAGLTPVTRKYSENG